MYLHTYVTILAEGNHVKANAPIHCPPLAAQGSRPARPCYPLCPNIMGTLADAIGYSNYSRLGNHQTLRRLNQLLPWATRNKSVSKSETKFCPGSPLPHRTRVCSKERPGLKPQAEPYPMLLYTCCLKLHVTHHADLSHLKRQAGCL